MDPGAIERLGERINESNAQQGSVAAQVPDHASPSADLQLESGLVMAAETNRTEIRNVALDDDQVEIDTIGTGRKGELPHEHDRGSGWEIG